MTNSTTTNTNTTSFNTAAATAGAKKGAKKQYTASVTSFTVFHVLDAHGVQCPLGQVSNWSNGGVSSRIAQAMEAGAVPVSALTCRVNQLVNIGMDVSHNTGFAMVGEKILPVTERPAAEIDYSTRWGVVVEGFFKGAWVSLGVVECLYGRQGATMLALKDHIIALGNEAKLTEVHITRVNSSERAAAPTAEDMNMSALSLMDKMGLMLL